MDVPKPTFYRITKDAIAPMVADKSALGTVPAAAHQYCEPLRSASALGWYIFPPCDIRIKFDGNLTLIESDGEWQMLTGVVLPAFFEEWQAYAPDDLKKLALPHVSAPFMPGMVQIWSGLLVSTPPGWASLVRPLVNQSPSQSYSCFEGLIETDIFKPCPVFINIRIQAVNVVLEFSKLKPLFQLQMVPKIVIGQDSSDYFFRDGMDAKIAGSSGLDPEDWQGLRTTIRTFPPAPNTIVGRYGAMVRKRSKS